MNLIEQSGRWPIATACFLLVAPITDMPAAEDTLADRLATCSEVTGDAERLACFDSLAKGMQSTPIVKADGADKEHALPPLADDVGKPKNEEEVPPEEYAGRVESCAQSDASGRWYFTFDNGQVWRQSNSGRLPFRECDFAVRLRRDMFGYKLEIPSEDRSIRVTRVR